MKTWPTGCSECVCALSCDSVCLLSRWVPRQILSVSVKCSLEPLSSTLCILSPRGNCVSEQRNLTFIPIKSGSSTLFPFVVLINNLDSVQRKWHLHDIIAPSLCHRKGYCCWALPGTGFLALWWKQSPSTLRWVTPGPQPGAVGAGASQLAWPQKQTRNQTHHVLNGPYLQKEALEAGRTRCFCKLSHIVLLGIRINLLIVTILTLGNC